MGINIVNQTNNTKFIHFEADFIAILSKTKEMLAIEKDYELSLIFVDSQQIHQVNLEYRNIDRPTDVISFALKDSADEFELAELEDELGDIFINLDAVVTQAKEYGHSERREICFLFTHGLLHLLGYDHMQPEDEEKMFYLQDVILDGFNLKEV